MRRRPAWGKFRLAWGFDPGRRLDMSSRQAPAEEPDYKRENWDARGPESGVGKVGGDGGGVAIVVRPRRSKREEGA